MTAAAHVAACLQQIAAQDQTLAAFLHVDAAAARDRADVLDAQPGPRAPLHGLTVAVKDNIAVAGQPLTAGSRMLAGYLPPRDATVVARLLAAGAIVIGKTNMDEFGMGSSTELSGFQATRNPLDPTRVPGGSSGGSAAAVAAGMAWAALGTDTGGSIRQPAAFCGLAGLKPTYGRVSRSGVVAYASSLDQVGPLGKTVRDVARLYAVIAGHDPQDATSADVAVTSPTWRTDLAGMRVGVAREHLAAADGLDNQIHERIEQALDQLRERGATIVPVSLPHMRHGVAAYYLVATAEASANLSRYDGLRYGQRTAHPPTLDALYTHSRSDALGKEVQRRILLGTFALSAGFQDAFYQKASRVRRKIAEDFQQAWQSCDLLLSPTSPVPPWPLGQMTADPLAMYLMDAFTVGPSLAGLPALSVPVGRDAHGLPIGAQLIGQPFAEATILAVGDVLQRAFEVA
jgi:aspartyl-tRNA(Asn)/glutamyl-tRNA(Gln) amidotransferase subunit A